MGDHQKWGTAEEIAFIDRLGTGNFRGWTVGKSRVELLAGYIQGLRYRQHWGLLDRLTVIGHACAALDRERGRHALQPIL